jgi:two-component system phosphate regulon sensor histidine kinase PhoR
MQSSKIRSRIALPFVILFLIVLGGILIFVSRNFKNHLLLIQEEALKTDLAFVNGLLKDAKNLADSANEVTLLWGNENGREVDSVRLSIFDIDGTPLGDSQAAFALMENHADRPEFIDAQLYGVGISVRYSDTLGRDMMYVCVPAKNADGDVIAFSRMAISVAAIDASVTQMQNKILVGYLVVFLMVLVTSFSVSSVITGPISSLTSKANLLASGDMNQKFLMGNQTSYEVHELALALNTMAETQIAQIRSMQAEQDKLGAILSQISDGVMIVNDAGLVVLINEACEPILGTPVMVGMQKPLIQVVRHHQYVDAWRECMESGEEQSIFLELPQSEKMIQCIVTPLSGDLEGSSMLLIRDLTMLRRLETVRRDFISNISHELRTPLAALKLLAETVADSAMDDPEMMQYFLQRMQVEVDSLTQMVSELLELARIESGKTPLQLQDCEVSDLLEGAMQRMQVLAKSNEVTMEIDIAENLPKVLADAIRLGQVLSNLVSNALKFTPEGGKVTLGAEIYKQNPEMICIFVADTGVGIPNGMLERVFERFFKTDQSRSKGGTGLGLSIAKHLVEAHGGKIWAESQEGYGSTFYLTIPRV